MYTSAAKRELFDVWGKTTPLGRAGEPQEIAEAIGYLASPRAGYITGTNIAVDGGSTGTLTPPQSGHDIMSISVLAISVDAHDAAQLAQF